MLGSASEADDAVQDAWLRLSRTDAAVIENLEGWLLTVIARVCLDHLRARRSRREHVTVQLPEPLISNGAAIDPEQAALMGDAVGLALFIVLDMLTPAERLSFVLHDVFGVPFDEIAPIVGRTPTATRQLASRARRRVRRAPVPDSDLVEQRAVVEAFYAAARRGDFDALLTMLYPNVVVRTDLGERVGGMRETRGARLVAEETLRYAQFTAFGRPALINGAVGLVAGDGDRVYSVAAYTVVEGRIAEIDILADPARLKGLDLTSLGA